MINDPKFYLVRPKNYETGIICKIAIDGHRFSIGTGETIISELWDKTSYRPNLVKGNIKKVTGSTDAHTELFNLKGRLDDFFVEIKSFVDECAKKGEKVSQKSLKSFVAQRLLSRSKVKTPAKETLNGFIDDYIAGIESGKITFTKKVQGRSTKVKYRKSTIKSKKSWQRIWKKFQTETKVYDFEDIDMAFYEDFMFYFSEKDYTSNSFGKMVKELKTIMSAAKREGLHNNNSFLDPEFLITRYEATEIYLTRRETDILYNWDFEGKKTYDEVRDVFLIGCYTALRFSDYSRIEKKFIFDQLRPDGKMIRVLKMKTTKQSNTVEIPLSPNALSILKKYDFNLPKIYEQKMNKYIKEVCEIAGINTEIEVTSFKGLNELTDHIPKYRLVKSHTARRTGATLMYEARIPALNIMMFTGHKTESNFMKYIKATKTENAIHMSENTFFTYETFKSTSSHLLKVAQ